MHRYVRSIFFTVMLVLVTAPSIVTAQTVDFPIPPHNPKQLFYLQRTSNTNTIICELNLNEKGVPDPESPVHVFWIRYTEGAVKKELNYIQRVFAYG